MICGKVYGDSSVLARFLIEISSHARHNNFSRTCKHEGCPRVLQYFQHVDVNNYIVSIGRPSIALNDCIRRSRMRDSFVLFHDSPLCRSTIKSFVIVDAHFLIRGSFSETAKIKKQKKKRAVYLYKCSEPR